MHFIFQSKSLNFCNEYFIACRFVERKRMREALNVCQCVFYSHNLTQTHTNTHKYTQTHTWIHQRESFFCFIFISFEHFFSWILFQFQFNFCCERTRWEYLRRAAFILRGFFFNFYIFGCIWFRIFFDFKTSFFIITF